MANENLALVIDNDLRTIRIPAGLTNIGVAKDKEVTRLNFKMPRFYGGFDLSQFDISINYFNAAGGGDVAPVEDISVNSDSITFTWLVTEFMTLYAGNVRFSVHLEKKNGDKIEKEYNTTYAVSRVLESLNPYGQIAKLYPTIVEEWKKELFGKFDGKIDDTLQYTGRAADAAVTGDKFKKLEHAFSSPYNFKGSRDFASLPTFAMVNDTYYCPDKKCRYTWNGDAWYQSSMNESDYEDELSRIKSNTNNVNFNDVVESVRGMLGVNVVPLTWEIGDIQAGNPNPNARNSVHSVNNITIDRPLKVCINGAYHLSVAIYNLDGTYYSKKAYVDGDVIPVDMSHRYCFMSGKWPLASAALTTDEIEDIRENVCCYYSTNDERDIKMARMLDRVSFININSTKLEYGSLMFPDGTETVQDNIMRTGFIEVEPNTLYQIYSERLDIRDTQYVFEYDENKLFIGYVTMIPVLLNNGVTVGETTRFIRLRTGPVSNTYALPELTTRFMVEKNTVRTYDFDGVIVDGLKQITNPNTWFENLVAEFEDEWTAMISNEFDLGFFAITDIHREYDALYKLMAYFAENRMGDFILNMGDMITDHYDTKAKAMNVLRNLVKATWASGLDIYHLRGNHDNNPVSTGDNAYNKNYHISNTEYYNLFTRSATNVVKAYPNNYFYRDFESCKIRVIFLDSGDIYSDDGELLTDAYNVMYQQKQIDWLINTGLNFMDKEDRSEWSVITVSHCDPIALPVIFNAFMNGTTCDAKYNHYYAFVPFEVNMKADFTEQGPIEYITHISGHQHKDQILAIEGMSPERYRVEIKNATLTNNAYPSMEELAMDFVTVDKKNRTVNFKRFGDGNDRSISY